MVGRGCKGHAVTQEGGIFKEEVLELGKFDLQVDRNRERLPGRENGMRKDGGYEIRQGIRKYKSLGIMEIWVQVRKRIGDELEE